MFHVMLPERHGSGDPTPCGGYPGPACSTRFLRILLHSQVITSAQIRLFSNKGIYTRSPGNRRVTKRLPHFISGANSGHIKNSPRPWIIFSDAELVISPVSNLAMPMLKDFRRRNIVSEACPIVINNVANHRFIIYFFVERHASPARSVRSRRLFENDSFC